MRIIHIVTASIFPVPGGLEISSLRISRLLAESSDSRVIVYTRKQPPEHNYLHPAHEGLEIVHLGEAKEFLLQPLGEEVVEHFQLDCLLLQAAIEERLCAFPGARHVLISFFASHSGFVAQHVALALGIPHIASIRGSDFSRDFRMPRLSPAIQFVVERAQAVVTTNHEQARALQAAFPSARQIRTIYNAVGKDAVHQPWTAPASSTIRLATDSGFSFKKATHVLLQAVSQLLEEGIDVTLAVTGGDLAREKAYWEKRREEYTGRYPGAYCFHDLIPEGNVTALLLSSHVYVSTSLGEGCSLSRLRALTLGIPMVVTRCGALSEIADKAGHVRLCRAGSVPAFTTELRSMIADLRRGAVTVDQDQIREWRSRFSSARERAEWEDVLAGV